MKGQKGITLVALIITIIVLLILAVVAITSIKNDGIIDKAKEARESYTNAANNEALKIDEFEAAINNWNSAPVNTLNTVY